MQDITRFTLVNFLTFITILSTLSGIIIVPMVYILLRDRSKSKYDMAHNQAILSEMRASFEQRFAKLNHELMATEARWRDVNHLLLSAQRAQRDQLLERKVVITNFFRDLGLSDNDTEVDSKLVFVLTPLNDEEQETYTIIKDVCARNGLTCLRGDEEFIKGDILPHVVKLMVKARIVIANIGSRNPNVYYELGISHAIDKQTILISQNLTEIPFDVKTKRIILYTDKEDLRVKITDGLIRALVQRA